MLAVGNPDVTHGALLALTGLKDLHMLRWHVGDFMELLPAVDVLTQFQNLVSLHLPPWVHHQMDRWSGYNVLDQLPCCDVHVEAATR